MKFGLGINSWLKPLPQDVGIARDAVSGLSG